MEELQFHPPLDSALIAAIAGDSDNIDDARSILESLSAEVIADGYTSGLSTPSIPDDSEPGSTELSSLDDAEIGDNDALRFLKVSFPRQSLTTLRFVLKKCHNDVIRAVDELLNHELIDEERELEAIVDGESGQLDDLITQQIRTKRKRTRNHQRAEGIQNQLDPRVSATRNTGSRWDQISSETKWLSETLSLSAAVVQSAYHTNASSLPATLNYLLEHTSWTDTRNNPDHEDNRARLLKAFPGLSARIDDVLSATKEDLTSAMQVCSILSAWKPSIGTLSTAMSKTTISKPGGGLLFDPAPRTTTTTQVTTLSALECREEASRYATRRDEAFKQAAHSYSSKHHAGTALYYSQLGRDLDSKMREYQLLAAKQESGSKSGTAYNDKGVRISLDLHGCTVHQALTILKPDLNAWYASSKGKETFTVITGLGHHSAGEAKLLPAVRKWLTREGWEFQVNGGQILVKGLQS